ncbi:hypothetical protein N7468_005995 [Penicillium chermesinum]|uniref:Secreted protein n=1 Tax=Penicillium chermesinum TaxID=63820 RepID=A0A9W9P0C3_9EURO|nr:uncharacterized protein N7468_005995 [Penicillium chermesinum]KAJ5233039.1 hypothetical protein N7468_005995 [Penicillium chermesinum]
MTIVIVTVIAPMALVAVIAAEEVQRVQRTSFPDSPDILGPCISSLWHKLSLFWLAAFQAWTVRRSPWAGCLSLAASLCEVMLRSADSRRVHTYSVLPRRPIITLFELCRASSRNGWPVQNDSSGAFRRAPCGRYRENHKQKKKEEKEKESRKA